MIITLEEVVGKVNTPKEMQEFLDKLPFKERLKGPDIIPPQRIIKRINEVG